jgi:hypothetical protein
VLNRNTQQISPDPMSNATHSQSPAVAARLCMRRRSSMRPKGVPAHGAGFGAPFAVRRALPI